ncbi:MAG: hypothetical protein BGO86_03100 [Chryseobacterium sp. 36-9]|nr:MAG: hypothetical protein BGO86_03100 [Chryseobacterium sp. 36-9]
MINLNVINGNLILENIELISGLKIEELFKYEGLIEIQKSFENQPYESFVIKSPNNEEYVMSLMFYKNSLKNVNISLGKKYAFPPFIITKEEKDIIKIILKKIGGEKNYSWGKVEFSEDIKGGVISIAIIYK